MEREHRRAKAAFMCAVARLRSLPELQQSRLQPLDDTQCDELTDLAQAAIVEAMVWARAFHDAAIGRDGLQALPGYRLQAPATMDAARYVGNKGIHVLIELTDLTHASTVGGYAQTPWAGSIQTPILRWVTPDRLPPNRIGNRGRVNVADARCHTSFVGHWAGQPVMTALTDVETWLSRW